MNEMKFKEKEITALEFIYFLAAMGAIEEWVIFDCMLARELGHIRNLYDYVVYRRF